MRGNVGRVADEHVGGRRDQGRRHDPGGRRDQGGRCLAEVSHFQAQPPFDSVPARVPSGEGDGLLRPIDRQPGPALRKREEERDRDRPGSGSQIHQGPLRGRIVQVLAQLLEDHLDQTLGLRARDEDTGLDLELGRVEGHLSQEVLERNPARPCLKEPVEPRGLLVLDGSGSIRPVPR